MSYVSGSHTRYNASQTAQALPPGLMDTGKRGLFGLRGQNKTYPCLPVEAAWTLQNERFLAYVDT